jgi:outer membrane beta-barrel protein
MLAKKILLILMVIDFSCVVGFGADEDPDIEAIEAEFTKKKEELKPESGVAKDKADHKDNSSFKESGTFIDAAPVKDSAGAKEAEEQVQEEQLRFTDLSKLVPFSEVSVIQKKFMPKTNRFQFHIGASHLSNNPFYDTIGLTGRLAFYFSESIGIEATAMALNRAPKYVTEDLKDVQGVVTSSIVSANSYYGLDLVLVPFYGKITWLDERIIPYDFYLSLGGGSTGINDVKGSSSTIHVAIGQIYALTKNFVVRWDLSGNSYQAEVPEVTNSGDSTSKKHVQNFRDVFLGGGISFLFPGAGYR